ncbi:hypothetical protein QBC32DRAFT_337879 [Pseudoneurospora amorphoporcata]|uniref:Zn(2)-C6 fungal-type domain-containing protein n=1 Tax=Pseudoneurospora amorphoporcata TaxID=241081 RepID=A0AAN6NXM8_9PEZI|nr:hypothetical protein QBC32DRAFT_337879 [Pseudoneurospora amorphoporcata]
MRLHLNADDDLQSWFTYMAKMTDLPSAIGPIRRAHRKSRTGCAACKARKIKCDEHHPSCINCISHGLQCPFLSMKANLPPRPSRPSPVSPSSPPSIPINPNYHPNPDIENMNPIAETDDDGPLPTLHLLFLHNFTSSTYLTLTTDPTVANFWRTSVVNLAFSLSSSSPSSSYLLRVLLSVSALHLAFQQSCPQKRDFYTAQAILLHQKATREAMRRMLPVIERGEDELGLYLFANLTIYVALASPRGRRADGRVYVLEEDERRRHGDREGRGNNGLLHPEGVGFVGSEAGIGMGTGGACGGLGFPDWAFLVNGPKSLSNNFILHNEKHRAFLRPFLAYGGRRWKEARGESSSSSSCSSSAALSLSNGGTPTEPEGSGNAHGIDIPKPPGPLSHLRELISRDMDDTNPHLQTYLFAIDELELSLTHLTSSSPTSMSPSTFVTNTTITTSPSLAPCAAEGLTLISSHTTSPSNDSPDPTSSPNMNTQGQGGDVLDAMLWLWAVSDSLVPLLKIPTQEAVAIFAHFGILLKHHERQWWLQGWGDHLILRAKDILDEEHQRWISWPLEVLSDSSMSCQSGHGGRRKEGGGGVGQG